MFLLAFVIVANELVLTVSTDSPLLCCLSLLLIFVNSSFKFRLFDKSSHV